MSGPGGDPSAGSLEALVDEGTFEPIGLLGVEASEPILDLGEEFGIGAERDDEGLGDPRDPHGGREFLGDRLDGASQCAEAVVVLDLEDLRREFWCDEGIAVSVASDPRAEAEWSFCGSPGETHCPYLGDVLLEDVGHDVAEQLVEVVDG